MDEIKILSIAEVIERYPEAKICHEILMATMPGWELVSPTCPSRHGYETWSIKRGEEKKHVSFHLSTRTILDETLLRPNWK